MKFAMIGDNCIDLYPKTNQYYETGNVVDTGANLIYLGNDVSIITTVGTDDYSKKIYQFLNDYGFDTSHTKIVEGKCAITMMDMQGTERIHGDYFEGVLADMTFSEKDIAFASSHDLVHSALWGMAEDVLKDIKEKGNPLISFDYADRLDHEIIDKTIDYVDYGFFSYHKERDETIEAYLVDKVARGMKIAVATMGEKGSLAYDGEHFYEHGIVPTTVVNTVGAGDSFIAGFISALLNGKSIEESLAQGAKLAAKIVNTFKPWLPVVSNRL
ncbi:MAG TPA: fructoselysine 6-kinase [Erysipelothrix sp.]|nr:fructoselysine 6-kinase [Erysipelothrix sp.]